MKSDRFFVYGRVNPKEYDWESQFAEVARQHRLRPEPFVPLDVGKVMGLAAEIIRLRGILDEIYEWYMVDLPFADEIIDNVTITKLSVLLDKYHDR